MTKKMNVAIAGLGTVGTALASKLLSSGETSLSLTAISARDANKEREFPRGGPTWYDNCLDFADDTNVDIVVELIGGKEGIAHDLVTKALQNKKHVVTANKALMAKHGLKLAQLAEENGVTLAYEASVAGGIPVIKVLREALKWNKVSRIQGILNGTCNFILSEMRDGNTGFMKACKTAEKNGYAEADSGSDIDGIDAGQKLSILAALAFGVQPNLKQDSIEGIRDVIAEDFLYASDSNRVIRLVALCEQTAQGILQWVGPCLIPNEEPLAQIEGVTNAVQIEGDMMGNIMLQGPGAGGVATASSVLSDLNDIVCGNKQFVFARAVKKLVPIKNSASLAPCRWYLRVSLIDEPGSMAKVMCILVENDVSIEEVGARKDKKIRPVKGKKIRPVIFITHKVEAAVIKKALKALRSIDTIEKDSIIMPILTGAR